MKIKKKTTLLEMACIVSQALTDAGITSFLSGGAVVTIYSENAYESYDLDFISHGDFKKISKVMEELGFKREKGRHFIHPENQYFVEFPGTAATVGDQPIREFEVIKTPQGVLKLLTPTYCVMDRLSAFYHWDDPQSLEQAVLVTRAKGVNMEMIEAWSKREGMNEKYMEFLRGLKAI